MSEPVTGNISFELLETHYECSRGHEWKGFGGGGFHFELGDHSSPEYCYRCIAEYLSSQGVIGTVTQKETTNE
jgi:hypothetical protein